MTVGQMHDEREHHDHFHGDDAGEIFSGPLYTEVLKLVLHTLTQAGAATRGSRILSVGCGDGRLEARAAPRVGHITAVDISPVAIAHAQERAARLGLSNVTFVAGDARELAFPAGSFDAVWVPSTLHHLGYDAIDALFRQSFAWLAAGGVQFSRDPSVDRLVSKFRGLVAEQYARHHSPDERELDPADISRRLKAAGFATVRKGYTDFFLEPVAWLLPHFPARFAPMVARADRAMVGLPLVGGFASSFWIVGQKA